ncbi:MAG: hypothetical protein AMR96_06730 [Candidatus Adiutrix intracellularis]|nr:MAG: hypothetical protein AMR96_06730 [Candidatus Adiutrix intracellularis]
MNSRIRRVEATRQTKETDIRLSLNLDSGGPVEVATGIGFFDHLLITLVTYAGWSLVLKAKGDLGVDQHHTVEDVGLVLGGALAEAVGDFSAHARFGLSLTPMDEALAEVAVDAGCRAFLYFEVTWPQLSCGDFEVCLIEEFWRAFCGRAGLTLHIIGRHGRNSHHLAEAVFKGVGRALALALVKRAGEPLSTKGVLG